MINRSFPSNWTVATLGEISSYIQRGKSPKYVESSPLAVINQKCIRWNQLQTEHQKYIHPEQIPTWDANRHVRQGDILWNSTGTGTVGRAYLVKSTDCQPPKVVDSHVTIVRPNPEVDSRIIFYWIKGPNVQNRIEELCDGSTNQVELSRTAISEIKIPLPPINEQRRIADKLDRVLARVDATNEHLSRVAPLIKRFRQSVLAAATSGRLTEDTSTTSRQVMLQDVALDFSYGSSEKSKPHGKVPVLRMGNIQGGSIDWSDLVFTDNESEIEKYELAYGDVLFNRTNSPELVGKTAIYNQGPRAIYAGYLIRIKCTEELNPFYLNYCLNSPMGRAYSWSVKSDGVSQSNINAKKLAAFSFRLPSIEEQSEIVRRVEKLFAFADRLEERLSQAQAAVQKLTPALLAKAFRGELVPQDPNDEPASELLKRLQESRTESTKPGRARKPRTRKSP